MSSSVTSSGDGEAIVECWVQLGVPAMERPPSYVEHSVEWPGDGGEISVNVEHKSQWS